MTTIITRVFEDEAAAQSAAKKIYFEGVPERAIDVISGSDTATLTAEMNKARVNESAIDTYAASVAKGHALLVVRATHIPLGAARITREVLAKRATLDVGEVTDDFKVSDPPEKATSVMKGHPLFLTQRIRGSGGPVMGGTMKTERKERTSAVGHHRRASRMFWPMPLLSKRERRKKVFEGGRHMSKMFWPMPLLSHRERSKSVVHYAGPVFSRTLGWPVK